MSMSPEARHLLKSFNRDLEREQRWKETRAFIARWLWLAYLAGLVGAAWALRAWL